MEYKTMTLTYPGGGVTRVHSPILTVEEKGEQKEKIAKAAAKLLVNAKEEEEKDAC